MLLIEAILARSISSIHPQGDQKAKEDAYASERLVKCDARMLPRASWQWWHGRLHASKGDVTLRKDKLPVPTAASPVVRSVSAVPAFVLLRWYRFPFWTSSAALRSEFCSHFTTPCRRFFFPRCCAAAIGIAGRHQYDYDHASSMRATMHLRSAYGRAALCGHVRRQRREQAARVLSTRTAFLLLLTAPHVLSAGCRPHFTAASA